ncbi:hypothetical protein M2284_003459 [Rhodococcus sp. LBL1]|nr:hypothetical protein [Rhodococcus sp. LBL1]MDH6685017.1 hypothetical protein [Rhodococcus sp. LBL2]
MTAAPSDPLLIVDADGSPIATTDVQSHEAAVAELITAAGSAGDRWQVRQAVGAIQARLGPVFPAVAIDVLAFLGHDVIRTMVEQLQGFGVTPQDTADEIARRRAQQATPNNKGGE